MKNGLLILLAGMMYLSAYAQLEQYPPRNVHFDPLTSVMSWEEPRITAVYENFDEDDFPPQEWTQKNDLWQKTDDGSGGSFIIPDRDSDYACVIDSIHFQSDTLITPALDLSIHDHFSLLFDSYYDGQGEKAAIYYSYDAFETCVLLQEMIPAAEWQHTNIDLSELSGNKGIIWFGFAGSQWAIDNVDILVLNDTVAELVDYHLFLNDAWVDATTETSYYYDMLEYGQSYTLSIGAMYTTGLSEKVYFSFTSDFLYIPRELAGCSYDNAVKLIWKPPLMPDTSSGDSRELWDTQFSFPCGDCSGEAGIESDGNYIYTTHWNAGNGTFFRYELDGNFLGSFVVSGGCMDVRDLAYDGELFWGSNASTTVWGMNFEDEVVQETITAPVAVRAIAYDQEFDAFWANNWDTQFTLFDKNGITINSFPVGSYGSFYGLAWDNQEYSGIPYLYGHSQDNNATIVQFDIATGTETGVTYNSGAFGTQNAGGLAICDGIIPGYRTMLGILQDDIIFGLEFGEDDGSVSYVVPENLLGFNVYHNDEHLDYVEYYEGQNIIEYWTYNLEQGYHEFDVSALYDLYPYGSPGDTSESAKEGSLSIWIIAPLSLPFTETWENGFYNYDWEVPCDNWVISDEIGNPGKSAQFIGLPELMNYSFDLLSYPLYVNGIEDGHVYFDLDVKLEDIDKNGTEKFIIGVMDDESFYPLETLINDGSTEWISKHYDISNYTYQEMHVKLVFRAEGENSSNIDGWFIDNIHVYQMCEEPSNLSLEPQFGSGHSIAKLDWDPPQMTYHWLYYHDNSFENAVSAIEPGYGFAQLFEPEDYPVSIQKTMFYVDDHLNYQNELEVYVLSGDGNSVLAGPVVVQAGEGNSWLTANFEAIAIEEGNFLIYIKNNQNNGPFIAVDDHSKNPKLYYGSIGNLTELSHYGYDFISSCEVYVKHSPSDQIVVNSTALHPVSRNLKPELQLSNISYQPDSKREPRTLQGYNIFRNEELIEFNWPESNYADTLYESGEYSYFISALYDQCESDTLGTVSISLYTDINKETNQNHIHIYPNPVSEQLNIVLTGREEVIHHFTLTSVSGQPVVSLSPVSRRIRLSISRLPEGLYIAEIRTGNKREFRKIIIN